MKLHTALAVLAAASLVGAGGARASGFAALSQSGSQMGNALAGGAAAAEDASTVWYNPAGMGRLTGKQATLGLHAILPSFKYHDTGSTGVFARPGAGDGGDGGAATPNVQQYGTWAVDPEWRLGIGINLPFGLTTEYDDGWRGDPVARKSRSRALNINPAVAWRAAHGLWIGAGINWQRFEVELTNTAGLLGLARIDAQDSGWGYNLGALYVVSDRTRVGASYRSRIAYTLDGSATFTTGPQADALVAADLTVPETASFSVFHGYGEWEIMLDATWTRWSRLGNVSVTRKTGPLAGTELTALPFAWSDTWRIGVGANYRLSSNTRVRLGAAYDPTPSKDATRSPRLPDQDRIFVSAGLSFAWSRAVTFDVAYMHQFIRDANVAVPLPGAPVPSTLVGRFENSANLLSFQYNHRFD